MHNLTTTLLLITIVLVLLPTEAAAFGAGDIPDFSYLNGLLYLKSADLILTKSNRQSFPPRRYRTDSPGTCQIEWRPWRRRGRHTRIRYFDVKCRCWGAKFNKDDVKRVYFVSVSSYFIRSNRHNFIGQLVTRLLSGKDHLVFFNLSRSH
jgi:hypothetical protein